MLLPRRRIAQNSDVPWLGFPQKTSRLQSIGVHRSISSLAHSPFLPAHFLFPLTQSSPASNKSIHFLPRSRSRPLHSLPPSSHTLPRKLTQTTGNIAPILPSGGHGDGHINSQAAHGGANHLYEGKWENSLFHCKNYNFLASAYGSLLYSLGEFEVPSYVQFRTIVGSANALMKPPLRRRNNEPQFARLTFRERDIVIRDSAPPNFVISSFALGPVAVARVAVAGAVVSSCLT